MGDFQQRWEGYLDPNTGILRNLVGAQTWTELRQREDVIVEARALELLTRPVPQTFDLDHLQALHRHLFQDVYPWAGEIRTVDMGRRSGPSFLPHAQVAEVMEHVRDVLSDVKWLAGALSRSARVHRKGLPAGRRVKESPMGTALLFMSARRDDKPKIAGAVLMRQAPGASTPGTGWIVRGPAAAPADATHRPRHYPWRDQEGRGPRWLTMKIRWTSCDRWG